jgi:hypothetical protein
MRVSVCNYGMTNSYDTWQEDHPQANFSYIPALNITNMADINIFEVETIYGAVFILLSRND